MTKTIVISDYDAVSAFGNNIDVIVANILAKTKNSHQEKFSYISGFNFYDYDYNVKTRIDICSQLCIHTTAQIVGEIGARYAAMIGLITASRNGNAISKSRYLEQLRTYEDPQYASPKDFVQSICNIPNSHASIECGIKGITNHYVGTSDAALMGLWQAMQFLKRDMANAVVVSAFDVISEEQKRLLCNRISKDIKYSEAAASIKVNLEQADNQNNMMFEILGVGFGSGHSTDHAVSKALSNLVAENNIKKEAVSFIISNSNSPREFYQNELRGLESTFNNFVPTLLLKNYIGECYAPFPLLSVAMLSRMVGSCLPGNLCETLGLPGENFLTYDKVMIQKDSVAIIIGYGEHSNAVAVCLKYRKCEG